MITVAIYHRSVPPGNKNQEKPQILINFGQGVSAAGDRAIDVPDNQVIAADVGVIQGWTHEASDRPHLRLRGQVIQQHGRTVVADSNLFLYKNTANPGHYLRYSFNGIFPNTGIYCDDKIDPARWQQIRRDLGLVVRDYRVTGDHVLLCLQRDGGWSMAGMGVVAWTQDVVRRLRTHTHRPIVIRSHPGDRASKNYLAQLQALPGVTISPAGRTMEQDLINCWAVINHNSSSVVGAAIEGYPIFVTDPDRSQCREIANTDFARIESPDLPDRRPWLERISMFHWSFDELQNGLCWRHMRQWI